MILYKGLKVYESKWNGRWRCVISYCSVGNRVRRQFGSTSCNCCCEVAAWEITNALVFGLYQDCPEVKGRVNGER